MTYDVYLRRAAVLGDGDPTATFEALLDDLGDEDELEVEALLAERARPATPEERRELEAARDALLAANPGFEVLGSLEESSSIQLDDQGSGGALVDLDPGEIGLVVSYGTDDPAGAAENIATCVRALTPLGWVAYDPQLERIVTGTAADVQDATAVIERIHDDLLTRLGRRPKRGGLLGRFFGRAS